MSEPHEELLNVYDASGHVTGALRRDEAKRSGLFVGAINVLLVTAGGQVLLQRRPKDKENGGRWDKSVGGHVGKGESFEQTAVREAGEELFDDPGTTRVHLFPSRESLLVSLPSLDLSRVVSFFPETRRLGIRDVRQAPGGGIRNVLYHVGVYLGRSDVPRHGFNPQASEIDDLAYFGAADVDRMLVAGELAPNMAFLWLTHARALLSLLDA